MKLRLITYLKNALVTDKLIEIVEFILNANPAFTEGFVLDPYNDKGGITDAKTNYFYLEIIPQSNGDTFNIRENEDYGCGGCEAEVQVKLIAKFKKCTTDFAVILVNQLKNFCEVTIDKVATDSILIYRDEYKQELTKDFNLLRIKFELKTKLNSKCKTQICNEDCC